MDNKEHHLKIFDAIYEQSLTLLMSPKDESTLIGYFRPTVFINDMRTIYMGGGRQNYKTTWLLGKLAEYPNALMIQTNPFGRNNIPALQGHVWDRLYSVCELRALPEAKLQTRLRNCTHLLVDDASYNTQLSSKGTMDYLARYLPSDVVVVRMG